MGWDLDPIIELKVDGKWTPLSLTMNRCDGELMYSPRNDNMFVERNYSLFWALSGSGNRGDENIIQISVKPRGLPEDCSDITREYMKYIQKIYCSSDREDYHYALDVSWVTLDELESYPDRYITYQLINEIRQTLSYASNEDLKIGSNDIRIIFYYDH